MEVKETPAPRMATLDYFKENYPQVSKLGDITWSHAVNSKTRLEKYLADPETMFLEFDISVSTSGNPIAAHPPAHESDLTFEEIIERAKTTKQGIKLDFKDPEIYKECLRKLEGADLKQPLFINADILGGTNAARPKFTATTFINLAKMHCPEAVLSVGWTTTASDPYNEAQISEMIELLKESSGEVTFPVRASLLPQSMEVLQRLLENPNYSLSVWNNEDFDNEWIKQNIDPTRAYIDLIVMDEGPSKFDPLREFNS